MSWLLALACADPEVDAWHRAIEVTHLSLGEDACDVKLVETEPEQPYLFVAISRGLPDVASVYWCSGPEECEAPFGSVVVTDFTETHLSGSVAEGIVDIDLCTALWFELDATRTQSGQVDLSFRSGWVELADLTPEACEEAAPGAIGDACQQVFELEGVQVGD